MGYDGIESMYVKKPVLEAALDAEGLALDYFRSPLACPRNPVSEWKPRARRATDSCHPGFEAFVSVRRGGGTEATT